MAEDGLAQGKVFTILHLKSEGDTSSSATLFQKRKVKRLMQQGQGINIRSWVLVLVLQTQAWYFKFFSQQILGAAGVKHTKCPAKPPCFF